MMMGNTQQSLSYRRWEVTDFIKSVASRLAKEGFVAMSPHLYSRPGQNELFTPENIMDAMRPMWSLPP